MDEERIEEITDDKNLDGDGGQGRYLDYDRFHEYIEEIVNHKSLDGANVGRNIVNVWLMKSLKQAEK